MEVDHASALECVNNAILKKFLMQFYPDGLPLKSYG